jgi:PTS system mannose-specific IIB component
MAVLLARVDSRLVHGQVLEAWVPRLGVDTILVVDRQLPADPFQRRVIESLASPFLRVAVVSPEAAATLLAGELQGRRVLVLFAGIHQAVEALEAGVSFSQLNLGNIHPAEECRVLTASVHLTGGDEEDLCLLVSRGILLDARAVPADRSPDVRSLIRCAVR